MKTVLILPYFGKLPNYFNLFLNSIKKNKDYNWLIITDDKSLFNYPKNVTVIYKSFNQVKEIFQSKFEFKISLETPHKLCDFKPTFGYVFEEYIKDYDYWGHCDPDMIFGNLNNFLNWSELKKYDKIFTLGHLTFYKNTQENNLRFTQKINGIERYKDVFSNKVGYAFDEKGNDSINTIFKENNFKMFTENFSADIDPYYTNFKLSIYNEVTNSFFLENIKKQIFVLEEGSIFRFYVENSKLVKDEFLYIHLQKRSMGVKLELNSFTRILITPKEFLPLIEEINVDNFEMYYKRYWFNNQYLKVKWKSLKYRINNIFFK